METFKDMDDQTLEVGDWVTIHGNVSDPWGIEDRAQVKRLLPAPETTYKEPMAIVDRASYAADWVVATRLVKLIGRTGYCAACDSNFEGREADYLCPRCRDG